MANRICWNCGISSHMTQYAQPYKTDTQTIIMCRCDNCNAPNIAIINETKLYERTERANLNNDYDEVDEWLPTEPRGKEYADVPNQIADAASEAYACYSIRSYRAAILLARSVLEACAKDKGITTGSLSSKINELAERNIISTQIRDEAHEIRFFGNEMAHGDFTQKISEEDAADMLGFLDTVLEYVYQMPAAIRRRQEARQNRKQHKQ
ncbi:DUF4145 domain-containing protein [Alloscardovia omnicolens]